MGPLGTNALIPSPRRRECRAHPRTGQASAPSLGRCPSPRRFHVRMTDPEPRRSSHSRCSNSRPSGDGSTPRRALAGSVELARLAERLGYRRLWVAEHHNMPGIASSSPAVLDRAPRGVDDDDPGRCGRRDAPQPRVARGGRAVRHARSPASRSHRSRARARARHRSRHCRRTAAQSRRCLPPTNSPSNSATCSCSSTATHPHITAVPGSRLPARGVDAGLERLQRPGRRRARACRSRSRTTSRRTTRSRRSISTASRFVRPPTWSSPYAMIGVPVICAETDERASLACRVRARSRSCVCARDGRRRCPTPEDAAEYVFTPSEREIVRSWTAPLIRGEPDRVRSELEALAARTGADELMITTIVHGPADRLQFLRAARRGVEPGTSGDAGLNRRYWVMLAKRTAPATTKPVASTMMRIDASVRYVCGASRSRRRDSSSKAESPAPFVLPRGFDAADPHQVLVVLEAVLRISQRLPRVVHPQSLLGRFGLHVVRGVAVAVGMEETNLQAPCTPDGLELRSRIDTEDVVVSQHEEAGPDGEGGELRQGPTGTLPYESVPKLSRDMSRCHYEARDYSRSRPPGSAGPALSSHGRRSGGTGSTGSLHSSTSRPSSPMRVWKFTCSEGSSCG